jgi:hypothetical protein
MQEHPQPRRYFIDALNYYGDKGNYSNSFLCYNRKIDVLGSPVEKLKTLDRRTIRRAPRKQGGLNADAET